jgi:hypothetical protein
MSDSKKCKFCGNDIPYSNPRAKYCSIWCQRDASNYKGTQATYQSEISMSNIGSLSEYMCSIDLTMKGYFVYKHININSDFDLVAYNPCTDTLLKVEVKTARRSVGNKISFSTPKNENYDVLCACEIDKNRCHYYDINKNKIKMEMTE